MKALLLVSASVAMAVHLWMTPVEASYSEFKEMARNDGSPRKFDKVDVALDYIPEEIYVKVPRGGFDDPENNVKYCKAMKDLQAENEPNDGLKYCKAAKNLQAVNETNDKVEYCKATTYLQAEIEEPNDNSSFKAVSNLRLVSGVTMGGSYMVQNDFMTLSRSLEKYDIKVNELLVKFSFKVFDNEVSLAFMNKDIKEVFWQGGLVKKLYKMIMALKDVNPAMEMVMHFEIFNNYDYMVDFMNKLHYVKVKFASAWQSTCLALWWLLAPHSGFRYLWISCLSDVVGGQIFLAAMVVLLVICGMGVMATSNMNPVRRMACQEHMSRTEKRRNRRVAIVAKKQFSAMMLICSCASSAAMEQEAVLQRIITLTEAATRAAMSAESTLNQVQSMASTSSGPSEGLQAASRILKAPDTFNGDDPMAFASWRFQFTSWLTFGDSRYTTLLEKVESLTSAPSITTYDTPEKELAHKLYAVLTSYLRGRCSHIIKAFAKSRDGFAIWYQLMREFEPTSRQRSLALAQALASYPVFAKDKSCLESILVYEQTVQQFEESSSTTYPDELKVATLMRCCNSKLREFLQLNIKYSSTYVEVREHIMNYERVSNCWTQEQVLKAIQQDPATPDSGGPTPMEIDRVEVKGKGKSKSKSKGKNNSGNGWSSGAWGFGRGRGRGRDSKGKGKKGRGKGKGKRKGKSKNKKEKGPTKERLVKTSVPFVMAMDIGVVIAHNDLELWRLTKFKNGLNNSHGLAILLHLNMFHIQVNVLNIQDYQHTSYQ